MTFNIDDPISYERRPEKGVGRRMTSLLRQSVTAEDLAAAPEKFSRAGSVIFTEFEKKLHELYHRKYVPSINVSHAY